MRIGILTYHRAENYGALLQAYALKTYLSFLGHEVSFVDYWPDYHCCYFKLFSWKKFMESNWKGKLMQVYYALFWHQTRSKRKQNLQSFMYEELGLAENVKYHLDSDIVREFDVVFYGSDQIWRKQKLPSYFGFDYWYFGSDNVKAHKVAYAASMGIIDVKEEEKDVLKRYFSHFYSISVREDSLKDFLTALDVKSQQVCDPVFLLNRSQWEQLKKKSIVSLPFKKYILVYNLLAQQETVRFSKKLSQDTGLPIIEINKDFVPFKRGKHYSHTAKVEDFLALIDHADYVVSNSFHGIALSIILGKQFYAVGMGERAGRVKSLLDALNISERYMDYYKMDVALDYNKIKKRIDIYVSNSKTFINETLSSIISKS